MIFFSSLISLFCLALGWTFTLFIAGISVPLYAINRKWGQICHHLFGRINLWIFGIKVEYKGMENLPVEGGVILAPNHESMFDILVMAAIPYDIAWLSKAEVGKIPLLGSSMRAMGCYFVNRDRSEKDLEVLRDLQRGLKSGISIIFFPEGTRTRTGELLPFKKGAFKTAQQCGCPIIPVALTGTRAIAKPGHLPTRGHRVIVRFGKPFLVGKEENLPKVMENFRIELTNLLSIDRTVS